MSNSFTLREWKLQHKTQLDEQDNQEIYDLLTFLGGKYGQKFSLEIRQINKNPTKFPRSKDIESMEIYNPKQGYEVLSGTYKSKKEFLFKVQQLLKDDVTKNGILEYNSKWFNITLCIQSQKVYTSSGGSISIIDDLADVKLKSSFY